MSRNFKLYVAILKQGTLKDFAARVGMNVNTVSRIVNQQHAATPDTAKRIADALDSTPKALGIEVYSESWNKGKKMGRRNA